MNFKKNYNKLINNGTSKNNKSQLNKSINIVNLMCLLWYFAFFLTSVLTIIIRGTSSPVLKANIIGCVIITMCLFFNKHQKYLLASFGVLLYTIFYYIILSCFIAPERFVEFFLVFVPCLSLVFFDNYRFSWIIFFLSIIAFYIPFLVFDYYQSETVLFLPPLIFFLFLVNFLIVLYFKKINHKNEKLLKIEKDKVLSDKVILEHQQRELKELNEFKSHFFVNLSHEIRTPLTLIQGYASRIDLNNSKQENQKQLDIINTQTTHIHSIINNILDLSKMDSKEFHLETNWVDLDYLLNKHYSNFKGVFEKKEVAFFLKNNTRNTAIKIDQNLFSKSLNNLLNNALKFTDKGGLVTLNLSQKNNTLTLDITDTGIGIIEQDLERIFDRFYQSKNHITKSQGSGIGLSFAKSIIENHGFSIKATSIPDTETRFSILIPENAFKTSPLHTNKTNRLTHKNTAIAPKKAHTKTLKNKDVKNVLIVDDHKQMRSYISQLLNEYQIVESENGKEALEKLKTQTFDLIITDYMMPVMNGKDFVNAVKEQQLKIPIIVLTARVDNAGKLAMLRLGIDGYLNKPFLEEELLIQVKKSLSSYDTILKFDAQLITEEKENLNKYAKTFYLDLRNHIFKNLNSYNLSVDSIAKHFEISKSTLNRKTKSILGQTTQQIIMETRFEKARQLLQEKPYESKKNIALSIGVTNSTYFFKKMEERFFINV